jgi:hypothetical protein
VVNVDAVAVRDDRDVDGIGHQIAEEHVVPDLEIREGGRARGLRTQIHDVVLTQYVIYDIV